MCKKRRDALVEHPAPKPRIPVFSSTSGSPTAPSVAVSSRGFATNGGREAARSNSVKPSSSSSSDRLSAASIRYVLPEKPNLYEFSEIFSATESSLARRLSSSSSNSWRCTVRGKDVAVFQRRFFGEPTALRRRIAAASNVHHRNIVRLLGAALGGDDLFLVYEYVNGASLRECLRNPKNPGYTPLGSWVDRMQVAADVAQGLQYIHHFTAGGTAATPSRSENRHHSSIRRGPIHDRIKTSSIMITEIDRRAKICHFGAVELARGTSDSDSDGDGTEMEEGLSAAPSKVRRSGSVKVKLEGARGYIAPEVRQGGSASQKSDVFAFGVVLLELLTGEEPVKYTYDEEKRGYEKVSLIESARRLMEIEEQGREVEGEMESCGEDQSAAEEGQRKIRSWMDRRLKDSFPVEVAERAARVALDCVQPVPEKRPDMVRVAAKLSALLMQSRSWADQLGFPEELTVSLAPR